jgi:hypothetical protein
MLILSGPVKVDLIFSQPRAALPQAVTQYRTARADWEGRLGIRIPRAAEETVIRAVRP